MRTIIVLGLLFGLATPGVAQGLDLTGVVTPAVIGDWKSGMAEIGGALTLQADADKSLVGDLRCAANDEEKPAWERALNRAGELLVDYGGLTLEQSSRRGTRLYPALVIPTSATVNKTPVTVVIHKGGWHLELPLVALGF